MTTEQTEVNIKNEGKGKRKMSSNRNEHRYVPAESNGF